MKKILILNILVLTILFLSCERRNTAIIDRNKRTNNVKEEFEAFYKHFHKDSVFQINRIVFPVPGINTDEMTVEDTTYYWKKENWRMHSAIDTTLFFKKMSISDNIVEEEVTSQDPGVIIKRKFQYIKGKWYLVYYEDINL